MPFKNTNVAFKLPARGKFQAGVNNRDPGTASEQGLELPAVNDRASSWVYFDCTVEVVLDSGMVVHNHLPQVNRAPDTLAVAVLDDPELDRKPLEGVNLRCQDQYADVIQRMGHARYWFHLFGQALRWGYQVPIPAIKFVGGVPAVPYDRRPQWAFNRIAPTGNYSGTILWHAAWSLWYTTLVPPISNKVPAADPAGHIAMPTAVLGATTGTAVGNASGAMQSPYTLPDDDAEDTSPPIPGAGAAAIIGGS